MGNKASIEALNELHSAVARSLAQNLDDPKVLASAIKFLKDNDITADLLKDDSKNSLGTAIKQHLQIANTTKKISVVDMLEMAE